MERKYGALSSSVNPQEISKTVEGVAKLLVGALVAFGLLQAGEATTVLSQVPILVSSGIATWGALDAIWGIIRKLIARFSK